MEGGGSIIYLAVRVGCFTYEERSKAVSKRDTWSRGR